MLLYQVVSGLSVKVSGLSVKVSGLSVKVSGLRSQVSARDREGTEDVYISVHIFRATH